MSLKYASETAVPPQEALLPVGDAVASLAVENSEVGEVVGVADDWVCCFKLLVIEEMAAAAGVDFGASTF